MLLPPLPNDTTFVGAVPKWSHSQPQRLHRVEQPLSGIGTRRRSTTSRSSCLADVSSSSPNPKLGRIQLQHRQHLALWLHIPPVRGLQCDTKCIWLQGTSKRIVKVRTVNWRSLLEGLATFRRRLYGSAARRNRPEAFGAILAGGSRPLDASLIRTHVPCSSKRVTGYALLLGANTTRRVMREVLDGLLSCTSAGSTLQALRLSGAGDSGLEEVGCLLILGNGERSFCVYPTKRSVPRFVRLHALLHIGDAVGLPTYLI